MVYQPSPAVLAAGRASIGGMFAARAAAAPDDPAITDLKRTLNYGALNARVNQLAHHLLARGSVSATASRCWRAIASSIWSWSWPALKSGRLLRRKTGAWPTASWPIVWLW